MTAFVNPEQILLVSNIRLVDHLYHELSVSNIDQQSVKTSEYLFIDNGFVENRLFSIIYHHLQPLLTTIHHH